MCHNPRNHSCFPSRHKASKLQPCSKIAQSKSSGLRPSVSQHYGYHTITPNPLSTNGEAEIVAREWKSTILRLPRPLRIHKSRSWCMTTGHGHDVPSSFDCYTTSNCCSKRILFFATTGTPTASRHPTPLAWSGGCLDSHCSVPIYFTVAAHKSTYSHTIATKALATGKVFDLTRTTTEILLQL